MIKVQTFSRDDAGKEDWLEARRGRVTGTRLADLVIKRGTKFKKGFWEIIAERVAVPATNENPMDRGLRIEDEALSRFELETGKELNRELRIVCREDNENIAYSPDATIGRKGKHFTETVEVKCLNSASHAEAFYTKHIPDEYYEQYIQPFCVNDKLKRLYFVFYDPRMPVDMFYIVVEREDIQEQITEHLDLQRQMLAKMDEIEHALIPM